MVAICLSVVLIGGALWTRFSEPEDIPSLTVVENSADRTAKPREISVEEFFKISTSTAPEKPLDQNDLIGRQLFSEYVSLSSNGGATPANLESLAERYVNGLASLDLSIRAVDISVLKTIADSSGNISAYGQTINQLRAKYQKLASDSYARNKFSGTESPAFSVFMAEVGGMYETHAENLINTPVPKSLAENHLNLINNYLSSAEAAGFIGAVESDPSTALAAINVFARNTNEETTLLANIQYAIITSGVYNSI